MSSFKRFCALVLSMFMLFTGYSAASAEYYEDNGGDSWEDAYIIDSVEDLKLMRDRINDYTEGSSKYYRLNADINITSEIDWEPIGINGFAGHFDGQNHIITLSIDRPGATNVGLFSTMNGEDSIIRNLNITGTLRGNWIGAFVWNLDSGTIENCTFSGTIEANTWAGAFVDLMNGGNISNCKFSGTIKSDIESAGGAVAELYDGTINQCSISQATLISCPEYAGGIIGLMHGGHVTNCDTQQYLTLSESNFKGGIVGGATYNARANVSGNSWPAQYLEIGSIIETDININSELNTAVISPVSLDSSVIEQIASNIGVSASEIRLLTSNDFSTATPPEPTDSMREQVGQDGYEFAAKLNTINVAEDGYYVFQVTVSDDIVGMKVSGLKLYYAEGGDFSGSSVKAAFGLMPILNGITGAFEVTNFLGIELDTLPKQFLATMFLSAGKSLTVYIVKILLAILGACSIGLAGGGVILAGGLILIKFFRRRH